MTQVFLSLVAYFQCFVGTKIKCKEAGNFSFMATLNVDSSRIPKIKGRYVAYLRSSDRPHSRLNIEAQRSAIKKLIEKSPARIVDEYIEMEPLVSGRRPELEAAIIACKAKNANLIFGKLDRMRSAVRWLEHLHAEGIGVAAIDITDLSRGVFWRMFNKRHSWRLSMSEKVKSSLADAKTKGANLGGNRGNPDALLRGPHASAEARKQKAKLRDSSTIATIGLLQHRGIKSLTGIATRLNQMGHPAPRGGKWSPAQVRRIIKKFEG